MFSTYTHLHPKEQGAVGGNFKFPDQVQVRKYFGKAEDSGNLNPASGQNLLYLYQTLTFDEVTNTSFFI